MLPDPSFTWTVCFVTPETLRKWQRLTVGQREMLTDAVIEACGPNVSIVDFTETAASFIESIPGLETLSQRQASDLVNHLWRQYMAKKPKDKKGAAKGKVEVKKEPERKAEAPAESKAESTPAKTIDLDKPKVQRAIKDGLAVLKEKKSKADAAWAIFEQLKDEDKELIVAAFVKGATLTDKGALTYWYNCKRRAAKEAKPAAK